jgi:ATP-dependent helicase YprA (DUF1998 family)
LVFDEAHTFKGAQGAETACLIRRLRSFCGKRPEEVTCVAASATMADPDGNGTGVSDFASRFFGVDTNRAREGASFTGEAPLLLDLFLYGISALPTGV